MSQHERENLFHVKKTFASLSFSVAIDKVFNKLLPRETLLQMEILLAGIKRKRTEWKERKKMEKTKCKQFSDF